MMAKDPWNSKTALVVVVFVLLILFSSVYVANQPVVVKKSEYRPVTQGVVSVEIVKPREPVGITTGQVMVNIVREESK